MNPGSSIKRNPNVVDNYIFIDTLTKIPVPNKLSQMLKKKEIEFTPEQIKEYKSIFDKLFNSI